MPSEILQVRGLEMYLALAYNIISYHCYHCASSLAGIFQFFGFIIERVHCIIAIAKSLFKQMKYKIMFQTPVITFLQPNVKMRHIS